MHRRNKSKHKRPCTHTSTIDLCGLPREGYILADHAIEEILDNVQFSLVDKNARKQAPK